jgi:UDP-N-acetylmuramoyl-tripeptide--D-alanyl-D-alanine ligase
MPSVRRSEEKPIVAETALWTVDDLVAATRGDLIGVPRLPLNGVSIDSRAVAPGDIFVAIKGEHHDGHDFAAAALTAGAGLAVVSRAGEEMKGAGPLLLVADPLRALEDLGCAARRRSNAQIVAITGSVGKTSTKEALKLALSASGKTHASAASFNNHWGVPLSLARMPADAVYGIFEVGMNHAGEITPLVTMVRPQIAVITAIAPSHLGYFNSLEEIADAKAEIFLGVERDGSAVINRDTPYFDRLAKAARGAGIERIVGFGQHRDAEVRLERLVMHGECSCVTAHVIDETVIYKLGVPGEHMALNSLALLAAVKLAGADLARAGLALAMAKPAKGRGVRSRLKTATGTLTLIDESYNANPISVRAALKLLAQAAPGKRGRRIAVLGDMLELGREGPALHAELAEAVDESRVDVLYASGPLMAHLWERIPSHRRGAYADTSEGLTKPLLDALGTGDVVMVKGSLGSRMGPVVEAVRARFQPADKDS